MKKSILFLTILFTFILSLNSCTKGELSNPVLGIDLCLKVTNTDFQGMKEVINRYLKNGVFSVNKSPETQLYDLVEWLDKQQCISAELLCNSCIDTYPAQSEIRIVLHTGGERRIVTLDILMSKHIEARGFHE
ncbi:MAG: hypothetical protein KBF75_10640 [Saprospiraceae bacterium]|jgi:hypothetical protein|nr:hypothetical protein [Saprospiraceae bacterium]MCA0335002.1 hypothetical protein [Bacteroidota bacterium]